MMNATQARERTQTVREAQRAERQKEMQFYVEDKIMGMITRATERGAYCIMVECPDLDTRIYARATLNDLGYTTNAATNMRLQISWRD